MGSVLVGAPIFNWIILYLYCNGMRLGRLIILQHPNLEKHLKKTINRDSFFDKVYLLKLFSQERYYLLKEGSKMRIPVKKKKMGAEIFIHFD